MDSMPASSHHSTESLPPVGLIHLPTPFQLCSSSPSAQLVGDELWGWLVRRGCSRAGGEGTGHKLWVSVVDLPVCSLSKPGTVGWAGDLLLQSSCPEHTSAFQRDAQERHAVPLGNRLRTVLKASYYLISNFLILYPFFVPQ